METKKQALYDAVSDLLPTEDCWIEGEPFEFVAANKAGAVVSITVGVLVSVHVPDVRSRDFADVALAVKYATKAVRS